MSNPLGKGLESLIPDNDSGAISDKPSLDVLEMQAGLPEPVYRMLNADLSANLTENKATAAAFRPGAIPEAAPRDVELIPKYARTRGESIFWIDLDKIEPNPYQPRRAFDGGALESLAESIKVHGVLQPIVVSKREVETTRGFDVRYQLIAGERRWRASTMAGLREIPAVIKRDAPPERQKLEWALIENVQREDLNPIERARAFKQLIEEFKLAQREVAERIGKSREYVANAVRLLALPPHIQEAINDGRITEGHARALLTLQDLPENQSRLFGEITANSLTVRDAELATRAVLGARRPTKRRNAMFLDPEIRAVQSRLEETLGTKVLLQKDGTRGKIVVEFYSDEELQSIINKIIRES